MTDLDASESVAIEKVLRKSGVVGGGEQIRNVIGSRYIFHNRVRRPGESVQAWVQSLKSLISACDFRAEDSDDFIRDR